MWYLILMTLAGSILFGGYLCWEKLCGAMVTQGMKYRALLIVLLVYTIPWVWIRQIYIHLGVFIFQKKILLDRNISVYMADISTLTRDYKTLRYNYMSWLIRIWVFVALLIMSVKICFYILERRRAITSFPEKHDFGLSELEKITCRKPKQYRKIKIHEITEASAAFTIGYVRPIIFVPLKCEREALRMILRHELIHVDRGDLLVKLLMELVCCLHWFNPVVYVLERHLDVICELSCDEAVVRGYGKAERALYARIVTEGMRESNRKTGLRNEFAGSKSKAVERTEKIMIEKKVKAWKKVVAAGMFGILVIANSLTALAYPEIHEIKSNAAMTEAGNIENGIWSYDMTGDVSEGIGSDLPEVILYDEQFTDELGNIYPVDSCAPQKFCFSHDKQPGTFTSHAKDDNGGCIVCVYKGTRCYKCSTIWLDELVSTTNYTKCPH